MKEEVRISLLEIDLTNETHRVLDVTDDVKTYLGGRGIANKLLWEQVPQGTDPLSPASGLHVGVGPVTGIMGSKTILSFMSPLTGWVGRSAISSMLGDEIVRAGYSAGIYLKGKAKRPVYLYIKDDVVEFRDASHLWGQWKLKTETALKDQLNLETGEVFAALCIGPAGENMVRYANASSEFVHSASKWGCGAVMGSKNLKAITIRGTRGATYHSHAEVWNLFRKYATHPATALRQLTESRWGHSTSPPFLLRYAAEGIKNNHFGYHPIAEKANHLEHQLKYAMWTDGCPGCAAACFVPFFKNSPKRAFGSEMRHDDVGGFNANVMLTYEETIEISSLVDELGMDSEELGGIVAWAMDLYEHGIITKADLGGIDLKWGNLDAILELVQKIAYKDGKAPAALAEGFRRAYKVFGEESKWYAYEVHGCACPTYDVRNKHVGHGLIFGTSHNGARMGTGIQGLLEEAATVCRFTTPPTAAIWGSQEEAIRLFLNAATGWNYSAEELKDVALRGFYFNRCLSLREGYHPSKDDFLPPRAYEETITDKYGTSWVWGRDEFEKAKANYYRDTLSLTTTGLPPTAEIERLGLGFVRPVMEPLDALG
ncbi:aldehyde ferredoxin oxidoreductase N-terminal domain-containing protein [Chloroflexota bacterium]